MIVHKAHVVAFHYKPYNAYCVHYLHRKLTNYKLPTISEG